MNEELSRFELLYDQYSFTFHGVKMNKVICLDLWMFANQRLRLKTLRVLGNFILAKNVYKMRTDCEILSTSGAGGRKDHLELYKSVIERLDRKTVFNNPDSWGYRLVLNPLMIFTVVKTSLRLLKNAELNCRDKIAMISEVCFYCNTLLLLNKLDFSRVKKYVCEIDIRRFENLLTQYLQIRKVPTFSMEEGMFYIFRGQIPHDSVHYRVLTTDKLLCWSQYVMDEYMSYGIKENRLILAGYPKKVSLYDMVIEKPMSKCIVLLARNSFREANYKLLNILNGYSDKYEFCLKLHPSLDYNEYSDYADTHQMKIVEKTKTINDCIKPGEFNWSIAVNTTAYYESLIRGLPCLRFLHKSFQLPLGLDDFFDSKEALENKIQWISSIERSRYQKEVNEMLKYTMGLGIDNYRVAILS